VTKTIPWEQVLDDKAAITIDGKLIKISYSHVSRSLSLEYEETKPAKPVGVTECYDCGKETKWGVQGIPVCNRCRRMRE
jgi:hypothetical protein